MYYEIPIPRGENRPGQPTGAYDLAYDESLRSESGL